MLGYTIFILYPAWLFYMHFSASFINNQILPTTMVINPSLGKRLWFRGLICWRGITYAFWHAKCPGSVAWISVKRHEKFAAGAIMEPCHAWFNQCRTAPTRVQSCVQRWKSRPGRSNHGPVAQPGGCPMQSGNRAPEALASLGRVRLLIRWSRVRISSGPLLN